MCADWHSATGNTCCTHMALRYNPSPKQNQNTWGVNDKVPTAKTARPPYTQNTKKERKKEKKNPKHTHHQPYPFSRGNHGNLSPVVSSTRIGRQPGQSDTFSLTCKHTGWFVVCRSRLLLPGWADADTRSLVERIRAARHEWWHVVSLRVVSQIILYFYCFCV